MNGLILSDSLLSGCPLDSINSLRKNHSLDSLDLKCFPGFTMGQLIGGNGEIHSLMQQKLYDQVFVVAGANNFSNDVEDDHVVKCTFIAQEFKDLFHTVCQLYKHTNFSFAPIPFRNLCKEANVIHRYPQYGSPTWIKTTNKAISLFSQYFTPCACHSGQLNIIFSPSYDFWKPLLSRDGLHLSQEGKRKIMQYFIKTESNFSALPNDFPPLPKAKYLFSFKPQVEVPKMVRKVNKSLPHHKVIGTRALLALKW